MSTDTKASVGIGLILAAVAALLVILYLLYHFTLASSQPTVSKENAPDYAKKAGMTNNPAGGPPQSGYGQGPQRGMGGPPQNMRGMMGGQGGQGGMGGPPGYAGQGGNGGAPGS